MSTEYNSPVSDIIYTVVNVHTVAVRARVKEKQLLKRFIDTIHDIS